MSFLKNMKVRILLLLAALFAVAVYRNSGEAGVYLSQCVFGVLTAIFAQCAFFGNASKTSLQSAAITGMIVAMLLAPGIDGRILWVAVAAAIASKSLARFPSGPHMFNPAALGLVLATCLFGNKINWWGLSNPYIAIVVGGFILYRLRRLSLVFSYILFRMVGAWILNSGPLSIDTLALHNLFFAFIMVVEPKTTPSDRWSQWRFGGGVGLLSALSATLISGFDGDLLALLAMNLVRPLLRRQSTCR